MKNRILNRLLASLIMQPSILMAIPGSMLILACFIDWRDVDIAVLQGQLTW